MADFFAALSNVTSSLSQEQPLPSSIVNQVFDSALSLITASGTSDNDSGGDGSASSSAEEVAAATSALELASSVLTAATEIDQETAADAVGVLNFVLHSPAALAASGAKEQLTSSIAAISDAVLQGASDNRSAAVAISTHNLNITAGKRTANRLADAPVLCQTDTQPAAVELPSDVLDGVEGVDASQAVEMLLYSSAVNLHAPAGTTIHKAEGQSSQPMDVKQSSSLISFSLRQAGKELKVNGTRRPIEITVPLSIGTNTTKTCIGQPKNATSAVECNRVLECQFWDEVSSGWSGEGCTTKEGPDGTVVCSCSHLTDFVVFEFPSSWNEVLSDALSGFNVNGLSIEAFQCLAHPSPADVPFLWTILCAMLVLATVSLWHATSRDTSQIAIVQALVQGRTKERQQRLKRAAAAFQAAGARSGTASQKRSCSHRGSMTTFTAIAKLQQRARGAAGGPQTSEASIDKAEPLGSKRTSAIEHACRKLADVEEGGVAAAGASEGASIDAFDTVTLESSTWSADSVGVLITPHEVNGHTEDGRRVTRRCSTPRLLQESLLHQPTEARSSRQRHNAKLLWARARRHGRHAVLATRWHKDVDRPWKHIWLDFKQSHTLLAAVIFRGSPGYTRAQTVHILLNSLALELVILCMMYSAPGDGPVVINPIRIISSGFVAALICMPGVIVFSWCFTPIAFVRFAKLLVLVPCKLLLFVARLFRDRVVCCFRPFRRNIVRGAKGPARSTSLPPLPPPPFPPPSPPSTSPSRLGKSSAQAGGAGGKWRAVVAAQHQERDASPGGVQHFGLNRSTMEGVGSKGRDIKVSYASLDEHLLRLSLRHALRRRDYRCAASIAGTWALSWTMFFGLMLTFSLYGCEFHLQHQAAANQKELLLSWGWSIGQRFLINEPFLIMFSSALPMMLSSQLCQTFAPCCTEALGEFFAMVIDVVVSIWRSLKI